MTDRPAVIVFDVNETLSDMSAMASRFSDVGAPPELARLWFAGVLRDGFALTAAGAQETFAVLAEQVLLGLLTGLDLDRDLDDAVVHVMSGMRELDLHPDVADGLRRLRGDRLRLVTLSNGSATVADTLLTRAGVREELEDLLTVEDASAWKPTATAYLRAAEHCGVAPGQMMLVAVHPWDIDGAARAGLRTAWLDRQGTAYPTYFTAPELTVRSVGALAQLLRVDPS